MMTLKKIMKFDAKKIQCSVLRGLRQDRWFPDYVCHMD